MLRSRDPDKPGIPPSWTPNYDTYERNLQEYSEEKTRQNRRRTFLILVISGVSAAIGYCAGFAFQHFG